MSANHTYLRRGGNQIVGMVNDKQAWKLTAEGWRRGDLITYNGTVNTNPWTAGEKPSFEMNFEKFGPIVQMYISGVATAANGVGAVITAPAGTVPAEFRPTVGRFGYMTQVRAGNDQFGGIFIHTDGSLQFQATDTNGYLTGDTAAAGAAVQGWRGGLVLYQQ
jgi:hypothetical protein